MPQAFQIFGITALYALVGLIVGGMLGGGFEKIGFGTGVVFGPIIGAAFGIFYANRRQQSG